MGRMDTPKNWNWTALGQGGRVVVPERVASGSADKSLAELKTKYRELAQCQAAQTTMAAILAGGVKMAGGLPVAGRRRER